MKPQVAMATTRSQLVPSESDFYYLQHAHLIYPTDDFPFRFITLHQLMCLDNFLPRKDLFNRDLKAPLPHLRQRMLGKRIP